MARAALAFFIIGLNVLLMSANGIGGLTMDIGKTLFFIFMIFALITFICSIVMGKKY